MPLPRRLVSALVAAAALTAACAQNPVATASAPSPVTAPVSSSAAPVPVPRPHATPARAHRSAATLRAAAVRAALDAADDAPCGRTTTAPTYKHVIWIWLENRSYHAVIGAPGTTAAAHAPYLNELANACGLATNYHNVSHPSQPNYFAAVAGTTGGVSSNCEPAACGLPNTVTLFTQLTWSGRQWRSYEESMPQDCVSSNKGEYVDRHNPAVYFPTDAAQCKVWDQPLGTGSAGPLVQALNSAELPAFSFVTPNVCTDMHSCSTRTGDDWLARWVPRIVASPAYQAGDTAVFITFDEGEGGHTYSCATNTTDVGCHVATIVVSPSTPSGVRSDVLFNHYSLLKTTEQLLGLRVLLGHAADPQTSSMVTAFGL